MTTAPTGFFLHEAAALHDTGWGHPEHQGRLRALSSMVGRDLLTLHGSVEMGRAEPADEGLLQLVHTREHVDRVRDACRRAEADGTIVDLDADTKVSPASWEAATGTVGAGVAAVEDVATGRFKSAFIAARPPGHHATPDRAMGFCLFNNVALAARRLQSVGHADRVLIVDWDVHHGNGTQDTFFADPSVYFVSLHQWPWWPGSGAASERGMGAGEGTTLNVPVPAGFPRSEYLHLFERTMEDVLGDFQPDFVLVSAGFDCMAGDPLGHLTLEPADLHRMTRILVERAEISCDGRVVAFLEGGYDPRRLGQGAVAVIRGLADLDHDGD